MDDVIANKAATIERCRRRAREEYAGDEKNLRGNLTKQDAIVLNIQRACEASIDLAMHLVRIHRLGIRQTTRNAFDLLEKSGYLTADRATALRRMVGFRNVAAYDYQTLNLDIVQVILEHGLDELTAFSQQALQTKPPLA